MENLHNLQTLANAVKNLKKEIQTKAEVNTTSTQIHNLTINGSMFVGLLGDLLDILKFATPTTDGIMKKEDKLKLDAIEVEANKYIHPNTHPAAMIVTDTDKRFVTDSQIAAWDSKAEGVHDHNSDYYTKTEMNSKLSEKAEVVHGHHIPQPESVLNPRKFLSSNNTYQLIPEASVGESGLVRLDDSNTSVSLITAPTSNALKKTVDLANTKLPMIGGTMTGPVNYIGSDGGYKNLITIETGGIKKEAISTYAGGNPNGDGMIIASPGAGLALFSGESFQGHKDAIITDKTVEDMILASDQNIRFISALQDTFDKRHEMLFDNTGLLSLEKIKLATSLEINSILKADTNVLTYKTFDILHTGNFTNTVTPGSINAYTKEETNSNFVYRDKGSIPIGSQELRLTMAPRRAMLYATMDGEIKNVDEIYGSLRITDEGVRLRSNMSTHIVINTDDIGEGVFRVQHGSGMINLLEVNSEKMLWRNEFTVLHSGMLDPKNVAPKEHGIHLPTLEVASDARYLRNDNTWQTILPSHIGTYNRNEIDNLISGIMNDIDWKEAVATKADIETTYPNPQDGWTVNVKDTNFTYRYNGSEWISISSNSMVKVTADADGLMSKEDKVKLDGMESNANNYIHPTNHPASIILETDSKRFVTKAQIESWSAKANAVHDHNTLYYSKTEVNELVADKANTNHGVHVPGVEVADNKRFLRNDNTWQTITAANIGALGTAGGTITGSLKFTQNITSPITIERNGYKLQIGNSGNAGEFLFGGAAVSGDYQYYLRVLNSAIKYKHSNGSEYTIYHTGNLGNASSSANGLMSNTDKSKLDGIATGANNYVHPSTHPASIIVQDANNKFVTDAQIAAWNAKAGSNVATQSTNGLMSNTDKTKLDGIAANANNYTHPSSHSVDMISTTSAKRFVSDAQIAEWDKKIHIEHNHDTLYYTKGEVDTKLSGKANSSHGNHVPALESANNTRFLRNDGTWQAVTASNIGAITSSDVNTIIGNGISSSKVVKRKHIISPQGGEYSTTTSSITGALWVKLPVTFVNCMMSFWIDVYEYTANQSFSVYVSGYIYNGGNTWQHNPSAIVIGSNNGYNIRFGNSGGRPIVYIGETNKVWSYPQFMVRDVHIGYGYGDYDAMSGNWEVGVGTTHENVTATIWKQAWHNGNFNPDTKMNTSNPNFSGTMAINGAAGSGHITGGGDGASSTVSNVTIRSWYGIGFGPTISGQPVPQHQNAAWINVRNGSFGCRGDVTAGRVFNAVWNDYAELFPKPKNYTTEPGDIIGLNPYYDSELYTKASDASMVVGVHSDDYAHLIGGENPLSEEGSDITNHKDLYEFNKNRYIPVGLAGRVRAKCIGVVKRGDKLVLSDTPGVARSFDEYSDKYTDIFGMAVEDKLNSDEITRVRMFIK